jgi:hypothetical protein
MTAAARSLLGDCCQNHDPMVAPVVYPYDVTREGNSLCAIYRCQCGTSWACWWDMAAAGWTAEDVASFAADAA